jgi:large subunit ribosomal protein L15
MQLNELRDNEGATTARKRVGRGIGSGLGKTAGRGHKGQKARSGVAIKGFEGGQNPIHMRLPKRGFKNPFRPKLTAINLDQLQKAIDEGRLDAGKPINQAALAEAGLVRRSADGVRLLGRGELKAKVTLELVGASASAAKAVEDRGGSINILQTVSSAAAEDAAAKKRKRASKGA